MTKMKARQQQRTPAPRSSKGAEEALRESEERFRSLVASSEVGILAYDTDIRFTLWNPAMERISGMRSEDLLGRTPFDVFPFLEEVGEGDAFREAVKGKASVRSEMRYDVPETNKSGYFESCHFPLRDANGSVIGGMGIIYDITERKRAEEALRENEARFRSVAQTASDAIICLDGQGGIVLWNDAAEAMFGYSAEEIVGRPLTCIMPERFREAHRGAMERVASTGQSRVVGKPLELVGLRRDGSEFPLELSLATWGTGGEVFFTGIVRDITECQRAEEALRESEERFRLLAENAQDVILRYRMTEPVGYEYISPAAEAMSGYASEEWYGDPHFGHKIVHPDDRQAFERMLEDLDTGLVELRWVCKDGSIIWTEQRLVPIYDDSGELVAVEGVVRDITERRRAEEALRESEELRRAVVEGSSDAIFVKDLSGRYTLLNRAGLDILGLSEDQVIGNDDTALLSAQEARRVMEADHAIMDSEEPRTSEEVLSFQGTEYTFLTTKDVLRNHEGKVAGIIGITRDITERRRAEKALRESEEEFRLVFENAKDAIFWADPETGLITKCNRAAEALLEKTRDEIVGEHQTALHPPERAAYYSEMFKRHLGREGVVDNEAEVITKSGRIMPVHIAASITSVGGKPIIQGIFRDITERKRAEEALREAREQLESKVERQLETGGRYGLTFRELTVLHLVADGKADKEIAAMLSISPLTAQKHVANILCKMKAACRTEAGVRAVREGLIV